MRLPSKLLGCMRVGVGVGAVMLGGCDAVAEAKARVLGEEEAAATDTKIAADAPAAPVAAAPVVPEPMLLSRDDGMAALVQDAVAQSKSAAGVTVPTEPKPTPVLPVEDLGRRRAEPEGSHAFVPYAGGSTLTGVLPEPERFDSVKPRERPRPKLARPVEDEPCEPGTVGSTASTTPEREWVCGPCGRG